MDQDAIKKSYIVDSACTECALGIIKLFENKMDLFSSTGPHTCLHGLEIFDARVVDKLPKSYNELPIDPSTLTHSPSMVYTHLSLNQFEKTC